MVNKYWMYRLIGKNLVQDAISAGICYEPSLYWTRPLTSVTISAMKLKNER